MLFASSDFGLSYALEWVAIPLFVWFTVRYVWKGGLGLKKMMENRERAIEEQLAAGEQAKREAEQFLAERRRVLDKTKADAEEIIATARRNAERLVEQGRQRAEEEYQHALRRAESAIQQELAQVREDVLSKVGKAVVSAASKVVAAELDGANHHRLIGEAISAAEGERAGA